MTRLSLAYLMDTVKLSRAGGDVVDCLLLAAIIQANDNQLRGEMIDVLASDALKRPISINALAASLHLPFETVRRRVRKMAERGLCTTISGGVISPRGVLTRPIFASAADARYERLRRFYFDLAEAGAMPVFERAPASGRLTPHRPVRAANRLLGEYVLRCADSILCRVGDPLNALILLELTLANTEHLTRAEQEAEIPIPDELRRPIGVERFAERLGLPPETLRRRLVGLEAEGFCKRTTRGVVTLRVAGARPGVIAFVGENLAHVQRLVSQLSRHGVLDKWDAEAELAATLVAENTERLRAASLSA